MTSIQPFQFPIEQLHNPFRHLLPQTNMVIQADTGTGKSTRLPVWAQDLGRVLVVEPRRVACTSLAGFVAESEKTALGDGVGYAIRFDYRFKETTNIVFVTPGVALRWFSEDKLSAFDVVMIDEFHERRSESDLLAGLLLKHKLHRLIVTSATLDSEKLGHYFKAEVLKASGRRYPVSVQHNASSNQMPTSKYLDQRIAEVVKDALKFGGDILVFLPGRKEISACQSSLKSCGADIIPLHSSVSEEDRNRALNVGNNQRVVLATNVAETSLTIPGIKTVIDSGLERRTHQRNGRTVLALHAISKASSDQRCGRAGRLEDGHCIRLYGEYSPLELFTPPELEREELVDPMLASACCGSRLIELPLLSRLPDKSVVNAASKLLAMGAIHESGDVTAHGETLYPLPIDSMFAHLISGMTTKANTEAMVDLAAVLQTPQKLWQVAGDEHVVDDYQRWNPLLCDAVTSVRVLRGESCEEIQIDESVLAEARQLASVIRDALELPQWSVASRIHRESWMADVVSVMPELAYARRTKRRQAFGNGFGEVVLSRDSVFPDKQEAAIVFDQFHLAGRGSKQTTSYATCLAPVSFALLVENGMGEKNPGEAAVVDGEIVEKVELVYAGRVIGYQAEKAQGQNLLTVLSRSILAGEYFDGYGPEIAHSITYWNLYQQINSSQLCKEVEPLQWLIERLRDLGVESADDLDLLQATDLVFDGIPEWEFEEFCSIYPLQVTLADLYLRVEYLSRRKTVVIHHVSGNRKADPKRWELPRWQGWKVQYRKASRLIDVK